MADEGTQAILATIDASHKVWVGNLTPETTAEELDAFFKQLGEPVCTGILKKGVGCVAYGSAAEADTAISAFNGSELAGAVIQTDSWTAKPTRSLDNKGKGKKGANGKGWGTPMGMGMGGGMMGKGAWGPQTWGPPAQMIYNEAWKGCGGKAMAWGGGGCGLYGGKDGGKWGGGKDLYGPRAGGCGAGAAVGAGISGKILWVNVGENALTQQGLPPDAPVMEYEKGPNIFSSSAYILGDIVGDIATEVEIVHDADWEHFPDVGEAVRAAAGEEHCFAIGVCASRAKWAIGCASGWKGRESAVKLALAVALAGDDPAVAGKLSTTYPEFRGLCQANGIRVGGGGAAGGFGGKAGGFGAKGGGWGQPAATQYEEPEQQSSGVAPTVHWLSLTQESKITAEGFPAEAPALLHTKEMKEYFSSGHHILTELVADISEVAFEDDSEWKVMPEVAAALTEAGAEENCYCVATCASQGVWAVGLAAGWKGRESAGKLALALALAQAAGRIEELGQRYPEFGEICAGAGLMQAPKKRRKGGW